MNEGERQVAPTLEGIRRDHTARYEFASSRLPAGSHIVDLACGVGYGSWIMAEAGHQVLAADIDEEALTFARAHYAHERITHAREDANDPQPFAQCDGGVCFETIEHLEDPRPLLRALRAAPLLIASVPNEAVLPWRRADGSTTRFHFRHYTKAQFAALLQSCGWCAVEWLHQAGQQSEVEPLGQGQQQGATLIVVAQRDALPEEKPAGRHVAICGLGPSLDQYLEITKRRGGRHACFDETWVINALGNVFDCDLVFHMDDVRIQEIRAAAAPDSNIAALLKAVKASRVPVVTSRAHPDYPALVEFPLEDVLNHLGHAYFNSTAAYAIALAIHTEVEHISVFGMDYTYPNAHDAEKGRACVEFWLGQAHARGMKITLPKTTTLMDSMYPQASRLYGYDTVDVAFRVQRDGLLRLDFKERDKLPTAEEIERGYDHSAPIAKQHLGHKNEKE